MPGGDGTGPMGIGSMTGRGAGRCRNYAGPGYRNPAGFGCGRGFRRMFHATGMPGRTRFGYSAYTETNEAALGEKEYLYNQVKVLENQLQQVKKRLSSFKEDVE